MTVKELKEFLNKLPENADVVLCNDNFEVYELNSYHFGFFKLGEGYVSVDQNPDQIRIDI